MFYHVTLGPKQISFNSNTLTITIHNILTNTTYDVTPQGDYEHWELLMKNHFPSL